jgi:hypothetical protein
VGRRSHCEISLTAVEALSAKFSRATAVEMLLARGETDRPPTVLHYFYEFPSTRALDLFRSLSKQVIEALIARGERCPADAAEYLEMCFGAENRTQECDEVVNHVLAPLLRKLKALVVCIDGIEQCDDDERGKILDGIKRLQETNNFKLMVAARDDTDLSNISTGPAVRIRVDWGSNSEDIRTYIDTKLLHLSHPDRAFGDAALRQHVRDTLIGKSGGMHVMSHTSHLYC